MSVIPQGACERMPPLAASFGSASERVDAAAAAAGAHLDDLGDQADGLAAARGERVGQGGQPLRTPPPFPLRWESRDASIQSGRGLTLPL